MRTARRLYDERELTVEEIGRILGVSRASIYRALGRDRPAASGGSRPGERGKALVTVLVDDSGAAG